MTDEQRVDRAIDSLIEHFDTVDIQVTKYRAGVGTESIAKGRGNDFARFGRMKAEVLMEERRMSLLDPC